MIINIGLGRTGNTSLANALTQLGYKTIKFPITPISTRGYAACVDISTIYYLDQLLIMYKEENIQLIHTYRDKISWLNSIQYYLSHKPKPNDTVLKIREKVYGATIFDKYIYSQAYDNNILLKEKLSKEYPLLNLRLGDGWKPLCQFLNKEIPNHDYPILNKNKY